MTEYMPRTSKDYTDAPNPTAISRESHSQKGGFLFRVDESGEFDELFAKGVRSVHVERMEGRSFWIGIDLPNGEQVNVRTGVERGKWYFRVLGDVADFLIEQPS